VTRPYQKLEILGVAFGSIAFAASFTYALLMRLSGTGPGVDADAFREASWVGVYTIKRFAQLPLWDPFKCGGVPLLADPQSRLMTPFFLLHLVFGPIVAVNLELTIHLAIAWAGGYLLARLIGLGYLPAIVCASVFPSSSWIYLHFSAGHISFISILYLPWILSMWLLSIQTRRLLPAAAAGLWCALAFAESGVYVAYLATPFLTTVALTMAWRSKQIWPLSALLITAAFALGFSSIKLLPTLALHIARGTSSTEIETPRMLAQEIFSRNQNLYRWLDGIEWGFYEYGAYVGPFFALLALVGSLFDSDRALPWMSGAAVMLLLSLGSPGWWAPWALLHRLPIYSYEHVPSRFLILFVLGIAPLAGLGAEVLCSKGWMPAALVGVILAAALMDCWNVNYENVGYGTAGVVASPPPWSLSFRQFWDTRDAQLYSVALSNQGALNCSVMNVLGLHAVAYNQPQYRGEQYLLGKGSATLSKWTPNALIFDVDVPSQAILVVNQNYDTSWKVVEGQGIVLAHSGLLAVRLPAGRQRLKLTYSSVAFVMGLSITTLTFLITLVLWRRESHQAIASATR
jgi:hypothetical protein